MKIYFYNSDHHFRIKLTAETAEEAADLVNAGLNMTRQLDFRTQAVRQEVSTLITCNKSEKIKTEIAVKSIN